jgi:hypothetical protein
MREKREAERKAELRRTEEEARLRKEAEALVRKEAEAVSKGAGARREESLETSLKAKTPSLPAIPPPSTPSSIPKPAPGTTLTSNPYPPPPVFSGNTQPATTATTATGAAVPRPRFPGSASQAGADGLRRRAAVAVFQQQQVPWQGRDTRPHVSST